MRNQRVPRVCGPDAGRREPGTALSSRGTPSGGCHPCRKSRVAWPCASWCPSPGGPSTPFFTSSPRPKPATSTSSITSKSGTPARSSGPIESPGRSYMHRDRLTSHDGSGQPCEGDGSASRGGRGAPRFPRGSDPGDAQGGRHGLIELAISCRRPPLKSFTAKDTEDAR